MRVPTEKDLSRDVIVCSWNLFISLSQESLDHHCLDCLDKTCNQHLAVLEGPQLCVVVAKYQE